MTDKLETGTRRLSNPEIAICSKLLLPWAESTKEKGVVPPLEPGTEEEKTTALSGEGYPPPTSASPFLGAAIFCYCLPLAAPTRKTMSQGFWEM